MSEIITFTSTPTRVTAASVPFIASPWAARDVSAYGAIDVEFSVVSWEGPSSPSLYIALAFGFQRESNVEWETSISVNLTATAPSKVITYSYDLRRYALWKVTSFTGATSAIVWVRGVGRRDGV